MISARLLKQTFEALEPNSCSNIRARIHHFQQNHAKVALGDISTFVRANVEHWYGWRTKAKRIFEALLTPKA